VPGGRKINVSEKSLQSMGFAAGSLDHSSFTVRFSRESFSFGELPQDSGTLLTIPMRKPRIRSCFTYSRAPGAYRMDSPGSAETKVFPKSKKTQGCLQAVTQVVTLVWRAIAQENPTIAASDVRSARLR